MDDASGEELEAGLEIRYLCVHVGEVEGRGKLFVVKFGGKGRGADGSTKEAEATGEFNPFDGVVWMFDVGVGGDGVGDGGGECWVGAL